MNIIDTHVDTITTIIDKDENLFSNNSAISLERLEEFDKKGIYFAIWLDKKRRENAFIETDRAISFYFEQISKYNDKIEHCSSFLDFTKVFDSKKTASLLCLEGAEALEGKIDNLYYFYEKGVKLITLTWNGINQLGSGSFGNEDGLTDFGKTVVRAMNELNILVDISHLNYKGFFDVIALSQKPIIASHSNAFTVYNSKRNLLDEQLREIKNTNSIISINIHSPFIDGTNECTADKILFHIDYLLNFLGEDLISLGTDFDGTNFLPKNINSISDINILYNLIEKTYNINIANKIFYENQLRFLKRH